ncbi:hypothetical protein DFH11DRAFT_1686038 [Phellopilus nigrolimitatus]|nr:hypothetical protein DFH11DRAFT_1686038 [Phellopilus nigrolimitatus]
MDATKDHSRLAESELTVVFEALNRKLSRVPLRRLLNHRDQFGFDVDFDEETLLSFLLKSATYEAFPDDPQPQTSHPFASSSSDAPLSLLRNLVDTSAVLNNTLLAYSNSSFSDHKFVSILRQSTALIHGLHASEQDTRRRVDALKARDRAGASIVYGEPIPLDRDVITEWCISRIEQWGRKMGMEIFKDEERNGHTVVMLGGKVLVVEVDFAIQRSAFDVSDSRISVASVKTSHALSSGTTGNTLERSTSLDEFILRTWNIYLDEVQSDAVESSMRAAQLAKDIQSHLAYLMKLDVLASQEGDTGLRWFNDLGLISAVTERVAKAEIDSLTPSNVNSPVQLDIFLSRAHALAIPYLVAPSMSFLVYLSPLAYYTLVCTSQTESSAANPSTQRLDPFSKLDVLPSTLHSRLYRMDSRPPGTTIATLALTRVSSLSTGYEPHNEQRPHLGRPHFRLPGTSALASLDHTFPVYPNIPLPPAETSINSTGMRDVWMLDFTNGNRSTGIVMTHSRMCEIQQIVNPASAMGRMMQMEIPPLPGSWLGLLINPTQPPSERYIAIYHSPSNAHPPLRLRLTAPNEAGFLLEKIPIVRDQCWMNETLKTVDWVAEDLMPDIDDSGNATEDELSALLNGTYTPSRIPVNVFLPARPPSFPGSGMDVSEELDSDAESAVPGLASISMSSNVTTPAPCLALAFAVHVSGQPGQSSSAIRTGLSQAALVLRHDRSRRRGIRVDVNVSLDDGNGLSGGKRPPGQLLDELEESIRRGGAFGAAGRVWVWAAQGA